MALKNFSREIRAVRCDRSYGRKREREGKGGGRKSGTGSEVGMWSEGEGEGEKRASGEGYLPTVRGSPSQITPVYALKCEMVQTAQLP